MSAREICHEIKSSPDDVAKAIDKLKVESKISADSDDKLTIIE